MQDQAAERILRRISTTELERRWHAVRSVMRERSIDFLLCQSSTDYLGGYVKWFTDMPAVHEYRATVIFPRDDEMTTIWHGARTPAEPSPPAWALRGVKKRISVPLVPTSLHYTSHWSAEKTVEELSPYGQCRIGLVGMGAMSAAFYKYVTDRLSAAVFEDATDLVDRIKAIKSEEEIVHIRETCSIQDEAFEYIVPRIQPGRRDFEIFGEVKAKCLEMGSTQQLAIGGSFPYGTRGGVVDSFLGNRVIKEGDQFKLILETNGPGGFYAHVTRFICIGRVSAELEEQFSLALEAQKNVLCMLKPGTDAIAIWEANNEFLRNKGYPEEGRIFAHSQGYDMVERPSCNSDETMKIAASMNFGVHPGVMSPKAHGTVCENYLVREEGLPECLHKTPQKIFVN